MNRALTNGKIHTGDEIIAGKAILIKDDIIEGIFNHDSIPSAYEKTDCRGSYIAPGFIDLQIAGAGGYLFSANITADALQAITDSILKTGTTGFLIVLPTNSPDVYRKAIRLVRENPHPALLGLHLEGPFINPVRRGAHAPLYIRKPDRNEVDKLLKDSEGIVKMVTLAPELCSADTIKQINDFGVVVCAGHSNATFSQAMEGFSRGIRAVTHLFNAMSPVHHRDPGLPGAAFLAEDIFASIVADGIHVDYNMVSIAKKIMKERLYLVSDAVEESTQEAVHHVRQHDRFTLPDGTLSGSALTMAKAVKNCHENADIKPDEAIRMATLYPARLMGLRNHGKIKQGMKADLVVFDESFEVSMVLKEGKFLKI